MTEPRADGAPEQLEDPAPEGWPADARATGDASVDAVLSTLDRLDALAVEEHLPVFEEAHRALRQSLDRPAEASGSEA
ncbi:MAG: hypothetical protein ACTHNS_00305 [Marmoricola sp.]